MISKETLDKIIAEIAKCERIEKSMNEYHPSAYRSGKMTAYHAAIEIIKRKVKENDTTDSDTEGI